MQWQMLTEKDHFSNSLKWMRSTRSGQVFLFVANWKKFQIDWTCSGNAGWGWGGQMKIIGILCDRHLSADFAEISFSFTDIKRFVAYSLNDKNRSPPGDNDLDKDSPLLCWIRSKTHRLKMILWDHSTLIYMYLCYLLFCDGLTNSWVHWVCAQ